MRWGGVGGRGGVLSLGLRVVKMGGGQRKRYIELMWHMPRVALNTLYGSAAFELMGACYWEEVGGWLC